MQNPSVLDITQSCAQNIGNLMHMHSIQKCQIGLAKKITFLTSNISADSAYVKNFEDLYGCLLRLDQEIKSYFKNNQEE